LESGADLTVYLPEHTPASALPAAVEIHPLQSLPDSLPWPSLLALEISMADLTNLRDWLKLDPHQRIPCPTEALILAPMPCAALGECGACAVPTRQGKTALACKDGPVFDLNELSW
jgi:hypothetical protein